MDVRERIAINGKKIPKHEFAKIVLELWPLAKKCRVTYFEFLTAVALEYFRRKKAEIAVLEVGLGGRLDATNAVASPVASVITNVELDHLKHLGGTVRKIAKEKCGIIRKNGIVITAAEQPDALETIKTACVKRKAKLFVVQRRLKPQLLNWNLKGQQFKLGNKSFSIKLLGAYQPLNAATAVLAILKASLASWPAIRKGLATARWPGRFEVVQRKPLVILSGDHNPHGIAALAATLQKLKNRKVIVFGVSKDKEIKKILAVLRPVADRLILTKYKDERGADPRKLGRGEVIPNAKTSVKRALAIAKPEDVVCVTGSLYLVGEVRPLWKKEVLYG